MNPFDLSITMDYTKHIRWYKAEDTQEWDGPFLRECMKWMRLSPYSGCRIPQLARAFLAWSGFVPKLIRYEGCVKLNWKKHQSQSLVDLQINWILWRFSNSNSSTLHLVYELVGFNSPGWMMNDFRQCILYMMAWTEPWPPLRRFAKNTIVFSP